jgi:arylsulfatase A
MQADPSETTNLYEARPGVASRLLRELELYVHGGRGTPGLTSDNDFAPINLWKSGRNY